MPTVSQLLVEYLKKEGVNVVFGYPGASVLPLYTALENSGIKNILVRHEQNAGHAANGYARITGRPGVCMATSGPGATNLITAIATAYMDSVPMVVITGQVMSELIGRDVFQEADITGACEPFVKHSYLIKEAGDTPRVIKEAFHIASTGRPGPVLVDIPVDIMRSVISDDASLYPKTVNITGYKPCLDGHKMQIKRAADAIKNAQKPVICAGGGAFISGAQKLVAQLAAQIDAPVISTLMGTGIMPKNNPLYLGMFGTHGTARSNFALYNADLLIVCGARLGDRAVARANQLSSGTTVIHIDIDPAEIGKNIKTEIPIVGDLSRTLSKLIKLVEKADHGSWIKDCTKSDIKISKAEKKDVSSLGINPAEFIEKLTSRLPDGCTLCADVGRNQMWSARHFMCDNGRFLTSGGMGTMGYSIPAAIGASFALGRVVCIEGDGSIQMNLQELQTLVTYNLPVTVFVYNNAGYLSIKTTQRAFFDGRFVGSEAGSGVRLPSLEKLAAAYGLPYFKLASNQELDNTLPRIFATPGPTLVEVMLDPFEVLGPKAASWKRPDGTMVSAPLEDMAPFLPWEEFTRQMIIPPIPRT